MRTRALRATWEFMARLSARPRASSIHRCQPIELQRMLDPPGLRARGGPPAHVEIDPRRPLDRAARIEGDDKAAIVARGALERAALGVQPQQFAEAVQTGIDRRRAAGRE